MSENDKVKPYHAKDRSTGQETADVVAAVLKHAAEREEAAKAKPTQKTHPKWMLPLGINVSVLALYLLVAPPSFIELNHIDPPPTEEQWVGLMSAMYMDIGKIRGFRDRQGRYPASTEEAGVFGPYEYLPSQESFQLVASYGDSVVVFDSSRDNHQEWGRLHVPTMEARMGG